VFLGILPHCAQDRGDKAQKLQQPGNECGEIATSMPGSAMGRAGLNRSAVTPVQFYMLVGWRPSMRCPASFRTRLPGEWK
jgi:hypothetical protein